MIRIGIVGSDNSHAEAFSKLTNVPDNDLKVEGAQVVSIFGLEEERTQEVADIGNIPTIVQSPDEMLGEVDAVIVVFRHGGLHKEYALPFVEKGIPTFVDKPMAVSVEDAQTIVDAAVKNDTLLTSYSTLRFDTATSDFVQGLEGIAPVTAGVVTGPADRASEYGGLPFYGVHVVELMLEAFGRGVVEVDAVDHHGNIVARARYKDDRIATLQFLGNASYAFHMSGYGKNGALHSDVGGRANYQHGLQKFLDMIDTGEWTLSADEMLESVRVLDAVDRAIDSGGTIKLA